MSPTKCQLLFPVSPTWQSAIRLGNPPPHLLFKSFVPWHWTPQGCWVWYPIQTLLSLSLCVWVCVFLMLVKCQQCRTHEFAPETRTKLWKTAVTHAARPNTYLSYIYYIYTYFDKFIWQLVNEMPGWQGSEGDHNIYTYIFLLMPLCFINIFDVITHVSDIWQCRTAV